MSQELAIGESLLRPRDPCDVAIVREAVIDPVDSQNACYHRLMQVLSWKRPFDSDAEEMFARRYIDSIPGATKDSFGNRHVYIPYSDTEACKIMWSCHIDTCHHDEGYQRLSIQRDKDDLVYVGVRRGEGNCLGADDGTGVWLMLEMIAKGRPGYYLFHRGEEKGCLGSKWIKDNKPGLLKLFDAAIALDRKAFDNIITHQGGERGCSEAFAASIGAQLAGYKADPTGAFTDTKQYFSHIPECTNLSVGYDMQHGPMEKQYLGFALSLRTQLIDLDTRKLVIERDPKRVEYRSTHNYGERYHWLNDELAFGHKPMHHPQNPDWIWCWEKRQDVLKADAMFVKGRGWVMKPPATQTIPATTLTAAPSERKTLTTKEAEAKWEQMVVDSEKTLVDLVRDYPIATARMLLGSGFKTFDLLCEIHGEDDYLTFSCEEEEEAEEEEKALAGVASDEGEKPVMPRDWD